MLGVRLRLLIESPVNRKWWLLSGVEGGEVRGEREREKKAEGNGRIESDYLLIPAPKVSSASGSGSGLECGEERWALEQKAGLVDGWCCQAWLLGAMGAARSEATAKNKQLLPPFYWPATLLNNLNLSQTTLAQSNEA